MSRTRATALLITFGLAGCGQAERDPAHSAPVVPIRTPTSPGALYTASPHTRVAAPPLLLRVTGSPSQAAAGSSPTRYALLFRLTDTVAMHGDPGDYPKGIDGVFGNYWIGDHAKFASFTNEHGIVQHGRRSRHCFIGTVDADSPGEVRALDTVPLHATTPVILQPLTRDDSGRPTLAPMSVAYPRLEQIDWNLSGGHDRRRIEAIGCPTGADLYVPALAG